MHAALRNFATDAPSQHGGAPEVHLVDLSLADGLDDNARLTLPWAHLLANAPFLLIWRESETRWAAVVLGVSSGVWEAPITLVAHPAVEMLLGSGEAVSVGHSDVHLLISH